MKKLTAAVVAFCLALLCASAAADVTLNAGQRENLGIQTLSLAALDVSPTRRASAQVLDPTPLISLLGELRAARAAAAASRNELERSEHLYQGEANVSLKALEAARTQALTDGGRLDALRVQLLANWGEAVAGLGATNQAELAQALVSGHAALVRAEAQQLDTPRLEVREARVRVIGGEENWRATVLGAAAQAANQGMGAAYLLRVPAALTPGRVLVAELRDERRVLHGVGLPRSALVRFAGDDWVFIEDKANHFVRRLVHPREQTDDGWLVADELHTGEHVVTVGAGLLLGAESGSSASD
jgi:hypothetical protein